MPKPPASSRKRKRARSNPLLVFPSFLVLPALLALAAVLFFSRVTPSDLLERGEVLPTSEGVVTIDEIRTDHPRIWLNQENLAEIRSRASGQYQEYYTELKNRTLSGHNAMVADAFIYALEGDQSRATSAIKKARNLADTITDSGQDLPISHNVAHLALVFDWTYDAEAMTSSAKRDLIDGMIVGLDWLDGPQPGVAPLDRIWASHPVSTVGRNMLATIAMAHESDDRIPPLFQQRAEWLQMFHESFRYVFNDDGGWTMGFSYMGGNLRRQVEALAALTSATQTNWFERESEFSRLVYFFIYNATNLDRGVGRRFEDSDVPYWRGDHYIIANTISHYYRDSHARWITEKMDDWKDSAYHWDREDPTDTIINRILFDDPTVSAKSPETLPLNAEFDIAGYYMMREGWQPDDALIVFKNQPHYFSAHNTRNNGAFSIYNQQGRLTFDTGIKDKGSSDHHKNYHQKAVCSSTMLVGGNYLEPYDNAKVNPLQTDYSDTRVYEATNDHTCIVADVTKAYDPQSFPVEYRPTEPKRVEKQTRSFVYLPQLSGWEDPIILVYDYVAATEASYEKRYLLHSENQPKVSGDLLQIDERGGRLFNKVLFSDNMRIKVVGGPGEFLDWDYKSHPFIEGLNLWIPKVSSGWPYAGTADLLFGQYRTEVIPARGQKTDRLLNVLIPTSVDAASPPQITEIETDKIMGAKVLDRVVIFDKNDGQMDDISYSISEAGSYKHLIMSGRPNGIYSVKQNGVDKGKVSASRKGIILIELDQTESLVDYRFQFTGSYEPKPEDRENYYPKNLGVGASSSPPNPYDLNGDEDVDGSDGSLLIGSWGSSPSLPQADFNGDGKVNGMDLGLLLANLGV